MLAVVVRVLISAINVKVMMYALIVALIVHVTANVHNVREKGVHVMTRQV